MQRHMQALCLLLLLEVVSGAGKIEKKAPAGAPAAKEVPPLVGAYYFSWYNLEDQWKRYAKADTPVLGEYDLKKNTDVIEKHHAWAKAAGIDFFAMLWTGAGSALVNWERADEMDARVSDHLAVQDGVKIALMYNLRDIVGTKTHGIIDMTDADNCQIFHDHISHAAKYHFPNDSYLKIAGSPVIFLHTFRDYKNHKECLKIIFDAIREESGQHPYVIGDAVWWSPEPQEMPWAEYKHINVSALTAYNLVDNSQPTKMGAAFGWYAAQLHHEVSFPAWHHGLQIVPSVMPGYDDRPLRGQDRTIIARSGGAELVHQWKQMLWFVKCQPLMLNLLGRGTIPMSGGERTSHVPIVMVNSFNEWHEGTEIEPSVQYHEQYLGLLNALKGEVAQEQLMCGTEKDAHFKAPKITLPRYLLVGKKTQGDTVVVWVLSIMMWSLVMATLWVACGATLLKLTGKRPKKVKVEDVEYNFHGNGYVGEAKLKKKMLNRFSWLTRGVLLATGYAVWMAIQYVCRTEGVTNFFHDRLREYEKVKISDLRVAREISHKLCPEMAKAMHSAKLEEWVQKLANNQITQAEFQAEMCGDNPLHYREIVQAHVDYLGREPEPEALKELGDKVESGQRSLGEVIESIKSSPEAAEWEQKRQQMRVKEPKNTMQSFKDFKEVLDRASEGALSANGGALLEALKVVEAQVESLKARGDDAAAAEAIHSFFEANTGITQKIKSQKTTDSLLRKGLN